jgi:tripartite-type tricarboxylate transporter receptor subunit TctC
MANRRDLLLAALAIAAVPAMAEAPYPNRPIRLIVPYPAGGVTDGVARPLAELMRKQLSQPVIVDNRAGANASVGARAVAGAAPDGYTLLLASNASIVNNPLLYKNLGYSPERDLKVISVLTEVPLVLVVTNDLPVRDLGELVAYLRSRPGKLNYASPGIGNPLHLAFEMFNAAYGLNVSHIPYSGNRATTTAMLTGDVQVMFDTVGTSLPFIKAGKTRALAVTSRERLAVLPNVPTLAESGLPTFRASTWFGLAVPSHTPPEIVARLSAAADLALKDTGFRSGFSDQGMLLQPQRSSIEIDRFIEADRQNWGAVITARNIRLD